MLYIRPIRDSEVPQFLEWSRLNSSNSHWSPDDKYANIYLVTSAEGEPVCYVPGKLALMIESLAPRPGITPRELAQVLYLAGQVFCLKAAENGIQEVVFWSSDPATTEACSKYGGFKEVVMKLFRRVL